MTPAGHVVRRAEVADAEAVTQILARGFHADPPLVWILSDAEERVRLSPAFFRPFVDVVLAEGRADVTEHLNGAALWLDVDVSASTGAGSGELEQRLIDGLGPENAQRFFTLAELFDAKHPTHAPHAYLLFVGVLPEAQNNGVGTELMLNRLRELDQSRRPSYLEASSDRNAALYARLGFAPIGESVTLPDGPTLYPMWRHPSAPDGTASV